MEKRNLKDLVPYDKNPRNNKAAVDKVLESLNRHGQVKPIVLSAKGKPFEQEVICAGHTTKLALERFGAKEAFVVVKEFADEAQFVDYNIRDNKVGEFAEWDEALLGELAADFDIDLKEMEFEFDVEEEAQEGLTDEDEVPEAPEEPTAKLGQIWKLGEHRLMCGDSTDREQVERLMDGEKADMVFTDPPYGVDYEGGHFHSGDVNIKRKREKLASDDSTQIYKEVIPVIAEWADGPCYTWYADTKPTDLYLSVEEVGQIHALIIWHKVNATYAAMNAQYKQRHEPCLYWKPKGSTLRWCGPTTEATVWEEKRDAKNEFHPTQKPTCLAERAIGNHDVKTVMDLFGGSGSTMIACEKLGKSSRIMEMSPAYCDVIIKRWEDFTGKKAELIKDAF